MSIKKLDFLQIFANLKHLSFSAQETGLSYRTINHYKVSGILDSTLEGKWSSFNGFDLVWLKTIVQLRDFGVSLNNIKLLKRKIFEEGQLGTIDSLNYINKNFEEEICYSILHKYDLYLIIFSDLRFTFHDSDNKFQWKIKDYKDQPHISLPLQSIITEVYNLISRSSKKKTFPA